MAREEKKLDSCLLAPENVKKTSTAGAILLCGLCTNRSDTVGDLGKTCLAGKK